MFKKDLCVSLRVLDAKTRPYYNVIRIMNNTYHFQVGPSENDSYIEVL